MVATLYLIRHGATEGSSEKRYYGSTDIPLSEEGMWQIRKISLFVERHLQNATRSGNAGCLRGTQRMDEVADPAGVLTAVYSSGLMRAFKSAEIIGKSYGLTPRVNDDLRERSFGIWEGMTFSEIQEAFPAEFEAWLGDPHRYCPMNGESTAQVKDRVIRALDGIVAGHAGQNIAIVAHGGVNRIILCHILGMPLENVFRIEQDYAAVNVIEFRENDPVVKLLNGRMHG